MSSYKVRLFPPCLALLAFLLASPTQAELWRSPLQDLIRVQIEKLSTPLPAEIRAGLGDHVVEYEGFVVAYLFADDADRLSESLRSHRLPHSTGGERAIKLPWHRFVPGDAQGRAPSGIAAHVPARPIPSLFLVQFAYPIQETWVRQVDACGIQRIGYLQESTFLVRAKSLSQIVRCGISHYLFSIDAFYTTDRVSGDLLARNDVTRFSLQYVPGTDLDAKTRALPKGILVENLYVSEQEQAAYLSVLTGMNEISSLVASDPDLLSVTPAGEGNPSDERQGQIIAGNHTGSAVTTPGYRTWLQSRGLLGTTNQQTVAVMDSGYDDGMNPGDHHPDMESPDRLDGLQVYGFPPPYDAIGHGTMVGGIIAGEGALGSLVKDAQGFYLGSGIAPGSKLFMTHVKDLTNLTYHEQAHADARNYPDGTARALIANESWNLRDLTSTNYDPLPQYQQHARFFDNRVIDGNINLAGDQPMTIVFAAGNFADTCNGKYWDTVSSPATAKNVIAVGATESYRPTTQAGAPPLDCRPCDQAGQTFGRPRNQDATHIGRVAGFSGRGRFFGVSPNPSVNLIRVKPDLVAPAVRVLSTVPYGTDVPYYNRDENSVVGCKKFFPTSPSITYHTYGSGTSFAAPVVSGVAALKRKWFLDRAVDPAPSLLKAALIATADTLGDPVTGHDHRPSPLYGWGRVNLNRLTDSRGRFYRNELAADAVSTGQVRTFSRTIDNGASDTYIVLAWTDRPTAIDGDSQAPLVNDLNLDANGSEWQGNAFNENLNNIDNGYSYRFNIGVGFQDGINTVEAILIPAGTYASGTSISITVTGANVPQGPQKFGLYAYNVR